MACGAEGLAGLLLPTGWSDQELGPLAAPAPEALGLGMGHVLRGAWVVWTRQALRGGHCSLRGWRRPGARAWRREGLGWPQQRGGEAVEGAGQTRRAAGSRATPGVGRACPRVSRQMELGLAGRASPLLGAWLLEDGARDSDPGEATVVGPAVEPWRPVASSGQVLRLREPSSVPFCAGVWLAPMPLVHLGAQSASVGRGRGPRPEWASAWAATRRDSGSSSLSSPEPAARAECHLVPVPCQLLPST